MMDQDRINKARNSQVFTLHKQVKMLMARVGRLEKEVGIVDRPRGKKAKPVPAGTYELELNPVGPVSAKARNYGQWAKEIEDV